MDEMDCVEPAKDMAKGDDFGLEFPVHPQAFETAGAAWLTSAFRRFGAIDSDNWVTRIDSVERCPGGATGAKVIVEVQYARSDPALHSRLFVKFSRDFQDAIRDSQRFELQSEAKFARLSRMRDFPVRVPAAYFADFEAATGTGILITEAIPFGQGGIEPQRRKCLDHITLDDPFAYYRTILLSVARLGGQHKAGRLPREAEQMLPYAQASATADPIAFDAARLEEFLRFNVDFSTRSPQLLPPEVASAEFLAGMCMDARRIFANEQKIRAFLLSEPDMVALMHWNAQVDNCWFWREADGTLDCGMIDWGRVGQITLPTALWGVLATAPLDIWDERLDELLGAFLGEYCRQASRTVSLDTLKTHLAAHIGLIGVSRVLPLLEVVMFRLPECVDARDRFDPMFLDRDSARNSLHYYVTCMMHWHRSGLTGILDRLLG